MAKEKYKKFGGKFYLELGNEAEYESFLLAKKESLERNIGNINLRSDEYDEDLEHVNDELDAL